MSYKKWYQIVYLAISVAAFYYVGKKLAAFEQWSFVSKNLINNSWLLLTLIQIALWSLNLGLESIRWQTLLNPFTRVNFFESAKMVLMGFTTGSITPMKTGEPGGKILPLKKEDRPSGILVSVYGSYLNSAVLLLTALFVLPTALSYRLINIPFAINLSAYSYAALSSLLLALSYVVLLFFFKQIKKRVRNTKWALQPGVFKNFKIKRLLILFLYTLLRIVTYNFQLYIWFLFFNIENSAVSFALLSPIYFALITLIPAMFMFDLGIRGSAAIFVFGAISDSTGAVLSAIFFLWFFNVAIPVLWGSLLLIRRKTSKTEQKNS